MDDRTDSKNPETTTLTVNRSRRRTLKALGVLGVASVAGSGTALGAQLDALVADGSLSTAQAAQLFDQTERLTPSDGAPAYDFGYSVAVSGDGTTALIGAYRDSTGGQLSGSAYVFDLTQDPPTETKLTASDAAVRDLFGWSVSVSGDGTTALVGARADEPADTNNSDTDSGSAYVYDLTQDPPVETKLTASDAVYGDNFGRSVSVSSDGTTALVGAPFHGAGHDSGAAYVYDLTQDPPTETKLTASDADDHNHFGLSVSVSSDGTTALIGAWQDDHAGPTSGSAYVYNLTHDPPAETKLTASDAATGDQFGRAVSVSGDGTMALVGAWRDDHAGFRSGSAYVYDLTQDPPTERKLTASDTENGDSFGWSVSVSGDGSTALIGAHETGDAGFASGSAYVYDLTQSPATETKLIASDTAAGDEFGWSVSMNDDGDTALIGAFKNNDAGGGAGSAYVFTLSESPKPIDPEGYQVDFVGGTVIDVLGEEPDAFYSNQHRLVRYINGIYGDGVVQGGAPSSLSAELRAAVDSDPITVDEADGTASVSFTVADGSGPVTLSFVSYTLPGGDFTRADADQQELVAFVTDTFSPGEYTLTVDLPPANGGSEDELDGLPSMKTGDDEPDGPTPPPVDRPGRLGEGFWRRLR